MKQWSSVNSIKMTNEPIAERSPFAVSAMTSIHAVAPFNATSHPQNEFNFSYKRTDSQLHENCFGFPMTVTVLERSL